MESKSASASLIVHRTMKLSKSEIPQIVTYQEEFLSMHDFYSIKILQYLESEVHRIAAHSSACRSLQRIPNFVG